MRDNFNFQIVNFSFLSGNNISFGHYMVFTFHSLSDMEDAVHIMITLDIVVNFTQGYKSNGRFVTWIATLIPL